MNIQMNPTSPTRSTTPSPLSETKTYSGTVLEKTGPNTALVQVGREKIEMTFTGDVPEGTFQFKVKGQTTEGYLIEQITDQPEVPASGPPKPDSSGVDATLLDELPPELKQAVARLLATGQLPQTPETVARLVAALQGTYKDLVLQLVTRPSDSALPAEADVLIAQLLATTDSLVDVLPERQAVLDKPTLSNVIALDVARVTLPTRTEIDQATPVALRQIANHVPADLQPDIIARIDRGELTQVREQLRPYFPSERPVLAERPAPSKLDQLTAVIAQAQQPSTEKVAPLATPVRSNLTVIAEVTPRLAEVTNDFRSQQRTIVSQLRQIEPLVEERPLQMAQVIESTANRLRQTFQQTDAMLHTSMRDEKQLIQLLSKLERGTELAFLGRGAEAKAVVQDVRQALEAFRFAPTNVRTAYLPELNTMPRPVVTNTTPAPTQAPTPQRPIPYEPGQNSPRVLQETVQKTLQLQTAELKLATPAANPEAAKLQTFLTTQQQVNKPDNNQQLQQILLALPVQLVEGTAGLHVHLQNKRPDEVIDWENNTLYVQLETPRLGDIGVRVETVNRKMQITIENDFPLLERLATPFLERTTDALQSTGYQDVRIRFDSFTKDQTTPETVKPDETPTGYDYRI
ncbi:hypothetical protein QK289_01080 [Exiguobacterium antarcticum]|uniref:Flagellar hook-length control protein-like C-terminal domain-containing protein n=1 Tax=Exiguobacterium antarcticum TaxID=132920 RepID=A0ABT6QY22_9BACL|nr:hypothetical protein [Exiguobacterium antarcticum]MDI3233580.1 hypothetical protein [Exiguobacterium antarcticum]